jgi:hypothetical protein
MRELHHSSFPSSDSFALLNDRSNTRQYGMNVQDHY